MFILTIEGHEQDGAYAVADNDGESALYLFEEEDAAIRYGAFLEAEDYPPMSVVEVEDKLAIKTCNMYYYRYVVITPEDFVIPPREHDFIQKDKMA